MEKELKEKLARAWKQTPEPIRVVILNGEYEKVLQNALGTAVDKHTYNEFYIELVGVLLRIQSVAEFEERVKHHPALTQSEGERVVTYLRDHLFSSLFSYLIQDDKTPIGTPVYMCVYTQKDTAERFEALPDSVKEIIASKELGDAFTSIVKTFSLSHKQSELLCQQVARVLTGLLSLNDFKIHVTEKASLPPQRLATLFTEVEQAIFKPVRMAIIKEVENKNARKNVDNEQKSA